MLVSAQQMKKIDLDDYLFNHQWFRVTVIVLRNLQNTNLAYKDTSRQPYHWLSTKKIKEK